MKSLTLGACLFAGLSIGTADAQVRYGDWIAEVVDDTTIASTTNDSGNALFRVCGLTTRLCSWGIRTVDSCVEGDTYDALVASTSSGQAVELKCLGKDKRGNWLQIPNYDAMNAYSDRDDYVGFAIPLESGHFRVVRFSLKGSKTAIADAEAVAADTRAPQGTKDLSL